MIQLTSDFGTFTIPIEVPQSAPLPEWAEIILINVMIQRLKNRLQHWLRDQAEAPSIEEFNQKLQFLYSNFEFTDEEDGDSIEAEALDIAIEMISARLAADGLPIPRSITAHAEQLIALSPAIRDQARIRVAARIEARDSLLRGNPA